MESHGEAGKIHCTEEVMRRLLAPHRVQGGETMPLFDLAERGCIEIKGKGMMKTYYVMGKRMVQI